MSQDEIFSPDSDTIDISGIDGMLKFTRYKPNDPEVFLNGLELAEDLVTKTGTILYTTGTVLSPQRIARILKIRETNPSLDLLFKLRRSAGLVRQFRDEIKGQMETLINRRQKAGVYMDLLSNIDENIESFLDDIMSEENLTLAIYQMKFVCDSSETKKTGMFFNHSLNVALLSLAIASSERIANILGRNKEKLVELCKVGLFHNYGSIAMIDTILNAEENKKYRMYWEANRNGYKSLGKLGLNSGIMGAIRYVNEYCFGRTEFIKRKEWPSIMANIVVVAEFFLRKESGLFGAPQGVRDIVDQLNVRMMEKKLNEMVVQALTLGLNMQDIFDFYQELDRLSGKCLYGRLGKPYPLTGFKSPTLFICQEEKLECEHIESSLYAVNLLKPIGELKPGKYRRCWLMTRLLNAFYHTHYKDIKKSAGDTDTTPEE